MNDNMILFNEKKSLKLIKKIEEEKSKIDSIKIHIW